MDAVADVLFGKTRQALLAQLFSFPEERVYLRELARRTGISSGSLQADLNQLISADLVKREQDGNRVFYSANTASPVFEDLRNLVIKTAGLPELMRSALSPLCSKLELALIYGSFAKGTISAASDIDVLVVGTASMQALLAALGPLESRFNREISVRMFKPDEFRQRRRESDRFVCSLLDGPTILLFGELDDA